MMKEREYMLKVIWRTIDTDRHMMHSFRDGTDCFFFKGIKLERNREKETYQMYNTGMQAYPVLPDSSVWYAYEHGIMRLADAMIKTKAEFRLSSPKYTQSPSTIELLKEKINEANDNNTPNLNQIKEEYEQQQRENR